MGGRREERKLEFEWRVGFDGDDGRNVWIEGGVGESRGGIQRGEEEVDGESGQCRGVEVYEEGERVV